MTDDRPTTTDGALPPARDARVAPYGSWRSPITARLIAESGIGLGLVRAAADSLFWVEMRPLEDGRYVVVRRGPDGAIADVTPRGHNSRTLVQEYGGGMYAVHAAEAPNGGQGSEGPDSGGAMVIWSELSDQRLYRQDVTEDGSASEPRPHHTGAGDAARPAVRGRARHARRPHADLRARATRRRRSDERARRAAH